MLIMNVFDKTLSIHQLDRKEEIKNLQQHFILSETPDGYRLVILKPISLSQLFLLEAHFGAYLLKIIPKKGERHAEMIFKKF
jgi:hypothetical protein